MRSDVAVRDAYRARAAEYAAVLGAVDQMHPDDRDQISTWGRRIEGPVLDVGCGPGQWTDYLHHEGVDVRGIDPVREFIAHAREQFPNVRYRTASLSGTETETASLAGMLCWYSLIHIPPEDMAAHPSAAAPRKRGSDRLLPEPTHRSLRSRGRPGLSLVRGPSHR